MCKNFYFPHPKDKENLQLLAHVPLYKCALQMLQCVWYGVTQRLQIPEQSLKQTASEWKGQRVVR